jgi:hypothetical protein
LHGILRLVELREPCFQLAVGYDVRAEQPVVAASASGSHCLTVVTATAVEYWVVTCTTGTAAGNLCAGGCGIVSGQATCI